jgi:hypothetical protein
MLLPKAGESEDGKPNNPMILVSLCKTAKAKHASFRKACFLSDSLALNFKNEKTVDI